jgi:hypothetical protein
MRIVEIIIDVSCALDDGVANCALTIDHQLQGFKSYAVRTVISGWYVKYQFICSKESFALPILCDADSVNIRARGRMRLVDS